MERALTTKELARLYPHLSAPQRLEMERWHRARNHARMQGLPVDEQALPPYPEHPPEDLAGLDPNDPDYRLNLALKAAARLDHQATD